MFLWGPHGQSPIWGIQFCQLTPFRKPSFLRWEWGTSESRDSWPLGQVFPSSSCSCSIVPTTAQHTPKNFISSKYGPQGRKILIKCWPRTPIFLKYPLCHAGLYKGATFESILYNTSLKYNSLASVLVHMTHTLSRNSVIPLYQTFVLSSGLP